MTDEPIDGEILGGDEWAPEPDDPFARYLFPTKPFGDLLVELRGRIADKLQREVTQEEFGIMLGNVNQVTVSRWQTGKQKPQAEQLRKIVALAQEHGFAGLTLERLQQSLNIDVASFAAIDPRVIRLNTLLLMHDEEFREQFFEVVTAVYHLLNSATRSRER